AGCSSASFAVSGGGGGGSSGGGGGVGSVCSVVAGGASFGLFRTNFHTANPPAPRSTSTSAATSTGLTPLREGAGGCVAGRTSAGLAGLSAGFGSGLVST